MPLQLWRQPFMRLALPLLCFVSLSDVEVPLKQKMTLSNYPCKRIRDPKSLRSPLSSIRFRNSKFLRDDIKGNLHIFPVYVFLSQSCKTSHVPCTKLSIIFARDEYCPRNKKIVQTEREEMGNLLWGCEKGNGVIFVFVFTAALYKQGFQEFITHLESKILILKYTIIYASIMVMIDSTEYKILEIYGIRLLVKIKNTLSRDGS